MDSNGKYTFLYTPLAILLSISAISQAQASQHDIQQLLQLSLEQLINVNITSTSHFDEDSLSVASTVSVISAEDWQQRGSRRTHDAISALPGVIAIPSFLGQYSVRIRGYAQSDARGIATLWDGVPISSYNLSTADVDRPNIQLNTLNSIEVIRGPGSSFYGADAFHGVVALNAFESDKDVTESALSGASNGYASGAVRVSRAIGVNHRLNVAIGANGQPDQDQSYRYTDSMNMPAYSERKYHYLSKTALVKLHSNPKRDWSYKIGLYYDHNDQDDFHGEGIGFPAQDVSDVKASLAMEKVNVTHKLSDSQSLEFEAFHWSQVHDFSRPLPFAGNQISIHGKETRWSAKMIYRNNNLFNHTSLSLALSHLHEKINDAHRQITNPDGDTVLDADLPFKGIDRGINSFLVDAKTTIPDTDWILHYGFRYDNYSDFGNQATPRLGIIYKLDNQQALKLLYGNAFRAPNAIEVAGSPFITGNPDIQPETIDTYELAYIRQTQNSKTEIVAFRSQWKDSITSIDTNDDDVSDLFSNIGDNSSHGLEASYQSHYADWSIKGSASYIRSTNKDSGIDYKAFPKFILNIGIGYQLQPSLSLYLNNRAHFDTNDGEGQSVPSSKLPTYWRTDINLNKQYNKQIQLFANIRNLFDRDNYLPHLVDLQGGVQDEPVSVELGLRYHL